MKKIFILTFFSSLVFSSFLSAQISIEEISVGSNNYGTEYRPPFIIVKIKNIGEEIQINLIVKAFVNDQQMINEVVIDSIYPNQKKELNFFWEPEPGLGNFTFRVEILTLITKNGVSKPVIIATKDQIQTAMRITYEPNSVHRRIIEQAVQYLANNYQGEVNIDEIRGHLDDLIDGVIDEDVDYPITIGYRSSNHFYRPTDERGLDSPINWSAVNSYQWGGQSNSDNSYDWEDALQFYRQNQKDDAYHALGCVIHLIQDLTVPAHTHLDIHWPDPDDYELYTENNVDYLPDYTVCGYRNIIFYTGSNGLKNLWDRVVKESYYRNRFYQVLDNNNHSEPSGSQSSSFKYLKDMYPSLDWGWWQWEIDENEQNGDLGNWDNNLDGDDEWWECYQNDSNTSSERNLYYIENTGGSDGEYPQWYMSYININNPYNSTFIRNNQGKLLVEIFAEQLIPIAIRASAGAIKMFLDNFRYELTISANNSGYGTTNPSPGNHTYNSGTVVSITATPYTGYRFVNWTGNVANPNSSSTTVTMTGNKTVTANFEPNQYVLTMAVNNSGYGSTNPSPGGHTYNSGTVVPITATPNTGYRFVSWTGNVADPNSSSTTVTMTGNKTVTANFEPNQYILTMAVNNSGYGTTSPSPGSNTYNSGTVVPITATPNTGYRFVSWTGNVADPNSSSTTVTMTGNKTVIANFESNQYILTMAINNSGYGTTNPSPGSHTYNSGTVVQIIATPNSGYRFVSWTGNVADPNSSTTIVTMGGNRTVISNFEVIPPQYTLTITVNNTGYGTINPSPGSHTYDSGTIVTITATPNTGYRFVNWTGNVDDPDSSITTVTMNSSNNVTANFEVLSVNGTITGYVKNISTNAAISDARITLIWCDSTLTNISVLSDSSGFFEINDDVIPHDYYLVVFKDGYKEKVSECFSVNNYEIVNIGTIYLEREFTVAIYISTTGNDDTGNGEVLSPYRTIQKGINSSINGDIITVLDGTYTGIGNVNIDFHGKAITLKSDSGPENCIIDCENVTDTCGFYFHSGENTASIVDGFTIRNGNKPFGGGIWCEISSPTIKNNIIENNFAVNYGGGIYCCDNSSPIIISLVIKL